MAEFKYHRDSQEPTADVPLVPSNSMTWVLLGIPLVIAVFSFSTARWLDWSLGWLYLGNLAATHVFGLLCVRIWNPILFSRRRRLGRNTKRWDIAILIALTAGMGATIFVATNDLAHQDVTTDQPGVFWLIAALVFALGYGLTLWCSVVNPFLEKTVRIQTDNRQRVIQTGPYALVRHPMYVGIIANLLATPVMLESWWTFIPVIWCIVILVIRTALEDRTLQAELPGYGEYSTRVRYRLVPGLW